MPPSPADIFLLLPGLRLPAQTLRDLSFALFLPGLQQLLACARRADATVALGAQPVLAQCLHPEALPAAALRLLALGGNPGTARWLCLDPVHLAPHERLMRVHDPALLRLGPDEAMTLAASLAPVFAPFGVLFATTAWQWHLRLTGAASVAPASLQPLTQAIRHGASLARTGETNWRLALNEAQMLLHAHPLNAARLAAGLLPVNSLWPWGDGALSQDPLFHAIQSSDSPGTRTALHSDDAVLRGLARHAGHRDALLPGDFAALSGGDAVCHIVHLDGADKALYGADGLAWRDALTALERDWFAPLARAWRAGEIGRVSLCLPGAKKPLLLRLAARSAPERLRLGTRTLAARLRLGAPPLSVLDLADD